MNPAMKLRIEACLATAAAKDYLSSLRPADDLLVDERADHSELDVLQSLERDPDDMDATAKLPMIDINALPPEVRANLGSMMDEDSQAVA